MSATRRPYPDFHHLPIGNKFPDTVACYIEVPKSSVNKYEYDEHTQILSLDRVLHSAVTYPGDYGFIPQTSAEDGDPLDVIIISSFTFLPNVMVECRIIGMMEMSDEKGHDAKVLAVVDSDPRSAEIRDVDHLPAHVKKEIAHFFRTYKDLEQGKWVEIKSFSPRVDAIREVMLCHKRYLAQNFYQFSIGASVPEIVTAFVESFNKYVWDNTTGILKLDRTLHSSISYPGDYGFVPETAKEDGDALDILIISTFTLQPGTLVDVRVLGVIDMVDEKGVDQKIVGCVELDPRMTEVRDITDIPLHSRREIEHFFRTYKELEVSKFVDVRQFLDRAAALHLVMDCHNRYRRLKSGPTAELVEYVPAGGAAPAAAAAEDAPAPTQH